MRATPILGATPVVRALLIILGVLGLAACDSTGDQSHTCRANLGTVEILEVFGMQGKLYVAGTVQHHCAIPSAVAVRFSFLDANGTVVATRVADLTPAGVIPAITAKEFEWSTAMINGVDSVTAMVVSLRSAAPTDSPQT